MTRLLTEARMDEIRANHCEVNRHPEAWLDTDNTTAAVTAFEDRADLLDEVESHRCARLALVDAIAEKRIEALGSDGGSPLQAGRFEAFTEVLRLIAPRVTPGDFATVAEFVKAVRKETGP
jgi:hypothetical protein